MERLCRNGASCKHFAAGDCFFSHVPEGGPGGFCWHHARGVCKCGDKCGKRHWIEPAEARMGGRQCTPCAEVQEHPTGLAEDKIIDILDAAKPID